MPTDARVTVVYAGGIYSEPSDLEARVSTEFASILHGKPNTVTANVTVVYAGSVVGSVPNPTARVTSVTFAHLVPVVDQIYGNSSSIFGIHLGSGGNVTPIAPAAGPQTISDIGNTPPGDLQLGSTIPAISSLAPMKVGVFLGTGGEIDLDPRWVARGPQITSEIGLDSFGNLQLGSEIPAISSLAPMKIGVFLGTGGSITPPPSVPGPQITSDVGLDSLGNLQLGSSIPAISSLVSNGIVVSLGTGGSVSSFIQGVLGQKIVVSLGKGGAIFQHDTSKNFRVYIKGVDFTHLVHQGNVSGDIELNFNSRASMVIRETENVPNALVTLFNKKAQLSAGVNATVQQIALVPGHTFDSSANFVAKLVNEYVWVSSIVANVATVTRGWFGSTPNSAIAGDLLYQVHVTPSFVEPLPFVPVAGNPIEVWYYNGDYANLPHRDSKWYRMFGGNINEVEAEYLVDVNSPMRSFNLACVGYLYKLTKRFVKATFAVSAYPKLSDILYYLDTNFLTPEGITLIYPPVDITLQGDVDFPNINVMDAVQKLCEITGYDFKVDFERKLYIYDRPAQTLASPYNITRQTTGSNRETFVDLKIKTTLALYANRIIIGGIYTMSTKQVTVTYIAGTSPEWPVESFTDSSGTNNRAPFLNDFTRFVSTPIQRVVSIKQNGVDQVFIELPNLTPPPYRWAVANVYPSTALSLIFDVLKTNVNWPQAGDTLTVVVEIPEGAPPPNTVENTAEIAARAAIEGFTGVHETVVDFGTFSDGATVLQAAQAFLSQSSQPGVEATWNTIRMGAEPGQTILVDHPQLGSSNITCKIEQASWSIDSGILVRWAYKASNALVQRDYVAAWYRFLKKLRGDTKKVTDLILWSLAVSSPGVTNGGIQVGTNVTNAFVIHVKATAVVGLTLVFKSVSGALTGPLTFQIRRNGIALTPAGITFASGLLPNKAHRAVITWSSGNNPVFVDQDVITLDILATPAGQTLTDVSLTLHSSY